MDILKMHLTLWKTGNVTISDFTFPSPLKELLLFGPELLMECTLCVADPRAAFQRPGFDAEPRLARARVGVVAQGLPRRAQAQITRGGFGASAGAEEAPEGDPVGLLRRQPAQNGDALAGVDQSHLTG